MKVLAMPEKISLVDLERHHSDRISRAQPDASLQELWPTLTITMAIAAFSFATFFVIPMMGQITVSAAALLMLMYLYYRRSALVAETVGIGSLVFWVALFASIQVMKSNVEVPLFFFTATGIPVCVM